MWLVRMQSMSMKQLPGFTLDKRRGKKLCKKIFKKNQNDNISARLMADVLKLLIVHVEFCDLQQRAGRKSQDLLTPHLKTPYIQYSAYMRACVCVLACDVMACTGESD